MLRCADGTYYTGSTKNLEARLKLHRAGRGAKYCRWKRPVELVYAKEYRYYKRVLHAELWLKSRSREEKEVLIRKYALQKTASAKSEPHDLVPVWPKSKPGPREMQDE